MLTATLTHIQEFSDLLHSRGYNLAFEAYNVADPATVYRDYLPAALMQLMEAQPEATDFKLQLHAYPHYIDDFDYKELYWSLQYNCSDGFAIRQMELFSRNPVGQHIFQISSNHEMPARQHVVSHFVIPPSNDFRSHRRHRPWR